MLVKYKNPLLMQIVNVIDEHNNVITDVFL
jgi:hypothetical protein